MIVYCQLPPGVGKVCGDKFYCQSFPRSSCNVPRPGVSAGLGLSAVVRIAFITNRFNVPGVRTKVWFEWRCLVCGNNCTQLGPGPSVGHNAMLSI